MNTDQISINQRKSPAPTLVIGDYPIGYASGFGEALFNWFTGFPREILWTAHPGHLSPADGKRYGQSINLPSPLRPRWLPNRISLAYYPFLKVHQFRAARQTVRLLGETVQRNSIKNILVIPVSPWILSAALALHKQYPKLNLVILVMDDWQGHHECHHLPYSRWRQRLLCEVVNRATVRFATCREMAAHYEETYHNSWQVMHNGVRKDSLANGTSVSTSANRVLLTGDVNVFRFDAVLAFAEAIERHNRRSGRAIEFTIMGDVAEQHRSSLSALRAVRLLGRRSHSESLEAMKTADLLYLPLAFGERTARISLYAMPAKLPEYLASGKSVFFHAPKESAVFRIAERYDFMPRLATINPEALDAFVDAWAEGKQNGSETIAKSQSAWLEEFDMDRLAARFQAAFAG